VITVDGDKGIIYVLGRRMTNQTCVVGTKEIEDNKYYVFTLFREYIGTVTASALYQNVTYGWVHTSPQSRKLILCQEN
jgi:hypothetical protein